MRLRARVVIGIAALLVVLAAGMSAGAFGYRDGWHRLLATNAALLSQSGLVRARGSGPALPSWRIDMKFEDWSTVRDVREAALARGVLLPSISTWVPAKLSASGERYRVRMRLKGRLPDHWNSERWSYRVQVRDGRAVDGMRHFSLQHPKTRAYVREWAWLEHLRLAGVLAVRYRFVDVVFNGERLGAHAVEERFEKEMLEAQGRREGVVLTFDNSTFWRDFANPLAEQVDFAYAGLLARNERRIERDPVLGRQRASAVRQLARFRDGTAPASQVFDVERLATYLAISELWQTTHAAHVDDINFYFDPVTTRLEPIGFDGHDPYLPTDHAVGLFRPRRYGEWVAEALADPVLARAYVQALDRVSRPETVDRLVEALAEPYRTYRQALVRDALPVRSRRANADVLTRDVFAGLRARQSTIRRSLRDALRVFASAGPAAPGATGRRVGVRNVLGLPVDVVRLESGGLAVTASESILGPDRAATPADDDSAVRLPPARADVREPAYVAWFEVPVVGEPIHVVTRISGLDVERRQTVHESRGAAGSDPVPPAPTREEALARHQFLVAGGPGGCDLSVTPGVHRVGVDLVLPAGIRTCVPGGVTLAFAPDTVLIARGPLDLHGEADAPATLRGAAGAWGGVVVLDSPSPSTWRHAVVADTVGVGPGANPRGLDRGGWIATGGITFYRSDLALRNSEIRDSAAEDALNVVGARIDIAETTFESVVADAFDGDFVTGVIESCTFFDVGGDAIDVSTSEIAVRDSALREVGDKALSVGERSRLRAWDLTIERVAIGVASKDGSHVALTRITIDGAAAAALAVYRKKPEYGPGTIDARQVVVTRSRTPTLVQSGSWIDLDGTRISGTEVDVKALYAAGVLGN